MRFADKGYGGGCGSKMRCDQDPGVCGLDAQRGRRGPRGV